MENISKQTNYPKQIEILGLKNIIMDFKFIGSSTDLNWQKKGLMSLIINKDKPNNKCK